MPLNFNRYDVSYLEGEDVTAQPTEISQSQLLSLILNDPDRNPPSMANYVQSTLQITELPPMPDDYFLEQLFNTTVVC